MALALARCLRGSPLEVVLVTDPVPVASDGLRRWLFEVVDDAESEFLVLELEDGDHHVADVVVVNVVEDGGVQLLGLGVGKQGEFRLVPEVIIRLVVAQ